MSESKHTPGPWVSEDGVNTGKRVVAPNAPKVRRVVAACGGPNRDGNASLIASAPDLLEALAECEEYFDNRADADWDADDGFIPNKEMRLLSVVREVIAKATGGVR